MLVGKGAEVNVLNIDGYSVLDVASNATKGNHFDIIKSA